MCSLNDLNSENGRPHQQQIGGVLVSTDVLTAQLTPFVVTQRGADGGGVPDSSASIRRHR